MESKILRPPPKNIFSSFPAENFTCQRFSVCEKIKKKSPHTTNDLFSSTAEIKLSSSREIVERNHYRIEGSVYEFCRQIICGSFKLLDIIKITKKDFD
jgi:hypothetical protein